MPDPLEERPNKSQSQETSSQLSSGVAGFLRWATTPPQAIAVYLICFILVAGLSFYVGTLNPKKATGRGPAPPVTAPRN